MSVLRTEDGVNIAYWTLGDGPPLLHLINHVFSHVELEWQVPALRQWYERLAAHFQVVRFDFRERLLHHFYEPFPVVEQAKARKITITGGAAELEV